MKDKLFVIRSKELPEEMNNLDWQELHYPYRDPYPEVPCVVLIADYKYGLVIPLQISETSNLRNFFFDFRRKVGLIAHNRSTTIFYVVEKSETKRRIMKKSLQDFFNVHGVH